LILTGSARSCGGRLAPIDLHPRKVPKPAHGDLPFGNGQQSASPRPPPHDDGRKFSARSARCLVNAPKSMRPLETMRETSTSKQSSTTMADSVPRLKHRSQPRFAGLRRRRNRS
jgi:hypothetical protein